MAKKIDYRCEECGSKDVRRDAWAEWDTKTQEWVLASTFDDAHCEKCGGECTLEEVKLKAPPRKVMFAIGDRVKVVSAVATWPIGKVGTIYDIDEKDLHHISFSDGLGGYAAYSTGLEHVK